MDSSIFYVLNIYKTARTGGTKLAFIFSTEQFIVFYSNNHLTLLKNFNQICIT